MPAIKKDEVDSGLELVHRVEDNLATLPIVGQTLLYMSDTLSSSLLVSFTFSKETTWMRCQLKYGIWVTRLAELTFSRKIQLLECVMVANLLSKLICAEGGVRVLVQPSSDRLV